MQLFAMSKLIWWIFFSILSSAFARMKDKQVVAAVKLLRNQCLVKAKTTLDEVDKMHQGNWDIDYNAQCYMYCVMNVYKLLDAENRLDSIGMNKLLALLPEPLSDYVSGCQPKCQEAYTNLEDKCVAAYDYTKCFYFCDPQKYFFP